MNESQVYFYPPVFIVILITNPYGEITNVKLPM